MYYITLVAQERIYQIEDELFGKFIIGTDKGSSYRIEGLDSLKITLRKKGKGNIVLKSEKPYPFLNDDTPLDRLIVLNAEQHLAILISDHKNTHTQTLKLPYQGIVRIGRNPQNDIVINHPYISGTHLILRCESGVFHVEDDHSTNGLFLNGKLVSKAKLKAGDVLSILNINIRLGNSELFFENVDHILQVNEIVESALGGTAKRDKNTLGAIKYKRSPRIQAQLPQEDIILANAPTAGSKYTKRKGAFISLLGTGTMFATSVATGVASPALLAARAASLVTPIASTATQQSSEKDNKKKSANYEKERMEKYGQYIAEQKAKIEAVAQEQRDILSRENPEAKDCVEQCNKLEKSFWERSTADRDFLDVRLGMGYEDLCVSVKSREGTGFSMEEDEVRELSNQIVEETRIVDNVPARLPLRRFNTVSVIGNRNKVTDLVRNMLVSLTTAHCFTDVKIVGIFDEEEEQLWKSLRWLPHVWDEEKQSRFLAFNQKDAHKICEEFSEFFKQRAAEASGYGAEKVIPAPYYIFVLGSKRYTEREEIMNLLTSNNPSLGVTSLFLFDDLYSLPHSCQFIVDVDDNPSGYLKNEVNKKFMFTFDEPVSLDTFDKYARRMSAIKLEGFNTLAAIPNGVSFLEGYGVNTVEELDVLDRWRTSNPAESLAAPMGVMAGGKTFALDINDKGHGPHGLVAGMTGSGKSETLQSWILSMCVNYHPHDVNFVIIDYKGGGMANIMEDLPHVVGKITNLDTNISRALVSLNSEIKRRQAIFQRYGLNPSHINEYQKLYHQGKATELLPHLVVVSDEFAELKKNEPEFMKSLVSLAQVGRSLGIHLVLATQRPAGVVDENIKGNSYWNLCLRVQNAADSREMLKRPDASRITQPGRTFVRVGEDLYFNQFQSYWSGKEYNPTAVEQEVEVKENVVKLVDINGSRRRVIEKKKVKSASTLNELEAIRQHLKELAEAEGIRKLDGPWLPELPIELTVEELQVPGGYENGVWGEALEWLKVPIGIFDDPVNQSQGVQYVDFATEGHLGIYGAPVTGKTTLLKTIVWSIGQFYKPSDVSVYIIDCGGWSMSIFADMPHVGGIALDADEEKITKLQQMLQDEIEERKKKFLSKGVSSLTAYGIYLVYTANSSTGVRYKVVQNIRNAVAFELTDRGDYPTIVGHLNGAALPKITGRCFYKASTPIEYQVALPMQGDNEAERSAKIKEACQQMSADWDGPLPAPIPVMPVELSFSDLYKQYSQREVLPLGIDYETIRAAMLDMSDRYTLLVSGTISSGKTTLLSGIYQQLREKNPMDKFYVFDSKNAGLKQTADTATHYARVNETESTNAMLAEIVEELNVRKRAQMQASSVAAEGFDEKAFIRDYPQLCIFIDDLKEFVDEVEQDTKNAMERVCRMAQHLGVLVFVAGKVADLERYNEIESLTRVIVGNQVAIGLGGNAVIHSFLHHDLDYKTKEQAAGDGNAYYYNNGHCIKIKLPQ